ncbi:arsinothricin resistance N-acetyltransferase ArsN1 family B [Parasphingorhabdus halotolerans]|uniref:N-acetyltransferase n=1 Tax=Parasphingorhabdus halotolerans TaxID=2725558 RepID=A0A6H2DNQ9_9SPHN|nr:arsinothricin resistance N-acetyltransferase ArsN1 family B [Parasphingorhabdus halotolerans]QJB69595.1 N-acetyltransferase [Parasphingorhabdus halotolerans]
MIAVRSATVDDAERCAEIYAPFVTDSWVSFELEPPDAAEMGKRMETALQSYAWLVAEIDGTVVGYAYGSQHRSREAYQTSCDVAVYVDPRFAGQGVGRSLYQSLFARLKARNVHALFAGIALPNDASIGLHQSTGFISIGVYREVGRKLGGWRDVQWFQRLL